MGFVNQLKDRVEAALKIVSQREKQKPADQTTGATALISGKSARQAIEA